MEKNHELCINKKGEQRIREFIKKCEEKRELILENGIDTANVEIVNEEILILISFSIILHLKVKIFSMLIL